MINLNSTLKKLLSVSLSVILAMSCLTAVIAVQADDVVEINAVNFPDPVWRGIVSEYIDTDDTKGQLSAQERSKSTLPITEWLEVGQVITDLKGIEYFTAVKNLRISDLGLESLDVSKLSNLQTLTVLGNNLTALDVSSNTALKTLNCRGNKDLTSLTLSSALTKLECDGCSLPALDVSMCTDLTFLNCYDNELTSLNLSTNTALIFLNCSVNHIPYLDLSANTVLGNATAAYLGKQTVEAKAGYNGSSIYVPLNVANAENIKSSSIENGENTGYDSTQNAFVFSDYDLIGSGIDYTYYVGLESAEDMDVHINISKDFYRVRYLTAETGGSIISEQLVNSGANAAVPALPQAPGEDSCGIWSADGVNITQDTDIYAVWADAHQYAITAFDSGTATISCSVCGKTYTAVFAEHINAVTGDTGYDAVLDVNHDGVINARDYALLIKMF